MRTCDFAPNQIAGIFLLVFWYTVIPDIIEIVVGVYLQISLEREALSSLLSDDIL